MRRSLASVAAMAVSALVFSTGACGGGGGGGSAPQCPATCPTHQVCSGTSCVDLCSLATVQAACGGALTSFNAACSGSLSFASAFAACQSFTATATTEADAITQCSTYAAYNAATWHSAYIPSACCCPSGEFCDYQTMGWTCVPQCITTADCALVAGRTACVPTVDPTKDAPMKGPHVCKADDGAAWHGCNGTLVFCTTGYYCFADSAGYFCTHTCSTDAQCGYLTQACCLPLTSGGSGTPPACGVCP